MRLTTLVAELMAAKPAEITKARLRAATMIGICG